MIDCEQYRLVGQRRPPIFNAVDRAYPNAKLELPSRLTRLG